MRKFILILSLLFGLSSLVYGAGATNFNRWSISLGAYGQYSFYAGGMLSDNHNYESEILDVHGFSGLDSSLLSLTSFSHTIQYIGFDIQGVYALNPRWRIGLRGVYAPQLFSATTEKHKLNEIGKHIDQQYYNKYSETTKTVDVHAGVLALEGLAQYNLYSFSLIGGLGFGIVPIHKTESTKSKCIDIYCSFKAFNTDVGATPLDMYTNDQLINTVLLTVGASYTFYTYRHFQFQAVLLEDMYYGVSTLTGYYDKKEVTNTNPGTETYTVTPLIFNTSLGINIAFDF